MSAKKRKKDKRRGRRQSRPTRRTIPALASCADCGRDSRHALLWLLGGVAFCGDCIRFRITGSYTKGVDSWPIT